MDLPKAMSKERGGKPKQEVRLAKWMSKLQEEGVSRNFTIQPSFLTIRCSLPGRDGESGDGSEEDGSARSRT